MPTEFPHLDSVAVTQWAPWHSGSLRPGSDIPQIIKWSVPLGGTSAQAVIDLGWSCVLRQSWACFSDLCRVRKGWVIHRCYQSCLGNPTSTSLYHHPHASYEVVFFSNIVFSLVSGWRHSRYNKICLLLLLWGNDFHNNNNEPSIL